MTAMILTGCQLSQKRVLAPKDLIISDLSASPKELTPEQVEKDLEFLSYGLANGYGGRNHLPDNTFQIAMEKLRSIERKTNNPVDLKNEIDRILFSMPDNHLKAKLFGEPSPERLSAEKKGNVGKNATKSRDKNWDVRLDRFKSKKIVYISITSFPSHKDKAWNGFLSEVKEKIKNASDGMVIDLRGNGGGDDTMGGELAKILFGRQFENPLNQQFTSQTPETYIIFSNYARIMTLQRQAKQKEVPEYFLESIQRATESYNKALAGELAPERITQDTWSGKKAPISGYSKPIYVLADAECASSCESTIDFLETHPFVKRVGENTAGYIHYGNIGYIILPNSRIEVQIPTHYNAYYDGRFIERKGLTPDVRVPSGSDAFQFTLQNFFKVY